MPGNWYVFMNHLCGQRANSDAFNRKSHVIFQIVYYLLHNGSKKNSATCQHCTRCIHNECRSKTLITILNWLGLCISYDELEGIDYTLVNSLLERCAELNQFKFITWRNV